MMNESAVSNHIRAEFAFIGPVWRNNVGAGKIVDEYGVERQIRWGLANDSAQLNREIKSSDLIGITPVTAYLQSVGWCKLGVFTALEVKRSDWVFSASDDRARAQLKFHDIVREAGGFAGFVTRPEDIHGIIRRG